MKSRWRRLAIFAALLALFAGALPGQELSERDAVAMFLRQSPAVRALRAGVDVTRADRAARAVRPNPVATYSQENAAGTRDDFLMVQQALPVNGRLQLLRKAGEHAVATATAESGFALSRMIVDVRLAFYELWFAQQRQAEIARGRASLDEVIRILRERESAGEGSGFDLMRAERESDEWDADLRVARAHTREAQFRLALFLGRAADASSLVARSEPASTPLAPVEELVAQAMRTRPDYMARQQAVEQLKFEGRAAERLKIPEPIINAGLKTTRIAGLVGTGYVASITVPIPLFNNGKAEVASFRAQQERVESELAYLARQIESEVRGAYALAVDQGQAADSYEHSQKAKAGELMHIAQIAYQEGERHILELLDAYRLNLQGRLRLIELRQAAKKAEIGLNRATGKGLTP